MFHVRSQSFSKDLRLKGHTVFGYWRIHCPRYFIREIKMISLDFYDEVYCYKMIGRNLNIFQSNQWAIKNRFRYGRIKYSPEISFECQFSLNHELCFFTVGAMFDIIDIKRVCYRVRLMFPEIQVERNTVHSVNCSISQITGFETTDIRLVD